MPSMVPLLFKPPSRPVVCFGESPIQLIGETRRPIPARPGQLGRYDCEYKRNGTANLFIVLDTHRSWRRVKVTDSRAAVDFAACVRELCDVRFPEAERIRVVLENLSTHSAGALCQPSSPAKRAACCAGWSSTTRPSTPAGSTGWRSKSAFRAANASTSGSPQRPASSPRSPHGNDSATLRARRSNGCSQPKSQNGPGYPDPNEL